MRTLGGGYGFEVMYKDEVDDHAKRYSQAFRSGRGSPWQTNYEEMAKKTVLKRVLKYAPLKSDFVRAIAADESIKTEISDDMFTVASIDVDDQEQAELEVNPETGEATYDESAQQVSL